MLKLQQKLHNNVGIKNATYYGRQTNYHRIAIIKKFRRKL